MSICRNIPVCKCKCHGPGPSEPLVSTMFYTEYELCCSFVNHTVIAVFVKEQRVLEVLLWRNGFIIQINNIRIIISNISFIIPSAVNNFYLHPITISEVQKVIKS